MINRFFVLLVNLMLVGAPLAAQTNESIQNGVQQKQVFGKLPDGREVFLYTLKNNNGMVAKITNYGGIIVSLLVPDRKGTLDDVVLGYDSLVPYVETRTTFGALIGRYANRIGNATFTLNGTEYQLAKNSGPNHIHGGIHGFNRVLWNVNEKESEPDKSLVLTYLSIDGEEGYPGNLSVKVVYSLTDSNELRIDYSATTDKPTVLNLTNHSYFNLSGAGNGDVLGEKLFIDADRYTPTDKNHIPTGDFEPVKGTPLDFTRETLIGAHIHDDQFLKGRGYDHNLVLNKPIGKYALAARVVDERSGRVMEMWTTDPGVQFYTANSLNGRTVGKRGKKYERYGAVCLEAEHFPDSPNKPQFPSTVLEPGMKFISATAYRFSTR